MSPRLSTTVVTPTPTPTPTPSAAPVIKLDARLGTFFGLACPKSVQVYTLAGRVSLPTSVVGGSRCAVVGSVPAPKGAAVGSKTIVLITGNLVVPQLLLPTVSAATPVVVAN